MSTALTDDEWAEFQSIPEQGYSHRAWVDGKIRDRTAALQAELRARELHHFEVEQENADLQAEIARLRAMEVQWTDYLDMKERAEAAEETVTATSACAIAVTAQCAALHDALDALPDLTLGWDSNKGVLVFTDYDTATRVTLREWVDQVLADADAGLADDPEAWRSHLDT